MSDDYSNPAPARTSVPAVVSLICGMLGWLVIPAVAAIVTGVIGLRQTRRPGVRGRGLAVGGLVLGTLTGAIGAGVAVIAYQSYTWGMQQVSTRLPLVMNAVNAADTASVTEYNAMTPAAMEAFRRKTAGWGRVSGVSDLGLTGDRIPNEPDQIKLTGVANFDQGGAKPFEVVIAARGDEVRIVDVTFTD